MEWCRGKTGQRWGVREVGAVGRVDLLGRVDDAHAGSYPLWQQTHHTFLSLTNASILASRGDSLCNRMFPEV